MTKVKIHPQKEVDLISPHRGRPNSLQIKPQLHSLKHMTTRKAGSFLS